MTEYFTLDDILNRHRKTYTLDDILSKKPSYTLDDILNRDRKRLDKEKAERQKGSDWELSGVLSQFAEGLAKEATLGIYKPDAPETMGEEFGRGLGEFVGFLTTPLKIGRVAGRGAASIATHAGAKLIPKVGKVGKYGVALAQHLAPHMATLGVAEAVSDVTDVEGMPKRFAHGAKIGAIFGAAGLSHIYQNKFYNQILSQFGGRALMAVAGEWSPDVFDQENLAQAVFAEALNTYFLYRGYDARKVLKGEISYAEKKRLGLLDQQREFEDAQLGAMGRLRLGQEYFEKVQPTKLNIYEDIIIDNQAFTPRDVELQKNALRAQGISALKGMTVEYDAGSEKYVPKHHHATIKALRELSADRKTLMQYDPVAAGELPDYNNIEVNAIGAPMPPRQKLLSVMKVAEIMAYGQKDKRAITSARISMAEETHRWGWDVKQKRLRPLNPIETPMKHEVVITQRESEGKYLEEFDVTDMGSRAADILKAVPNPTRFVRREGGTVELNGGWTLDDSAIKKLADAYKQIEMVRKAPFKAIPPAVKGVLRDRLKRMKIGVEDPDKFLFLSIGKTHPRMRELGAIEEAMRVIENAHPGARLRTLMNMYRMRNNLFEFKETSMIQDEQILMKQLADDEYFNYLNWENAKKFDSELKSGKRTGTLLSNQLSLGWWKGWKNVEKVMHDWEMRTGIPFWTISRKLNVARRSVDAEVLERMKPFEKFKHLTMEEQYQVYDYYDAVYKKHDTMDIYKKLSKNAREYIDVVDKAMDSMKGHIAYYRMKNFIELNADLTYGGAELKSVSEWKEVFKYQNNALTQEKIKAAFEEFIAFGEQGLKEYMMNGKGRELGTLQAGVYLPGLVLGRKPGAKGEGFLTKGEFERHVDFQGRTHVHSRQKILDNKLDLADVYKDLGVQNLNERINSYMRQVLNLQYMEPHLKSLNELVTIFYDDLKLVRGTGKFNFLDAIRLYAHRKKGFPVHQGAIGHALKKTQAVFFRALTASNPYLWLRNLYQPWGTHPHKEFMLDPRYIGKRFKDLPQEYQDRFYLENSQMGAVEHHYFFSDSLAQLEGKPLLGLMYRLAKPVGKVYAMTDNLNRQRVYQKSWHRSKDYFTAFKEGRIDINTMEKRVGMEKLDPMHRKKVRNLIDEGKIEEAAHHISTWYVTNSQWIYERSEKSLHEMTAEGEAWTNLLTWTKSINQSMHDAYSRIKEGVDRGNDSMITAGGSWIIGTLIAGQVGNQLLRHVSNKHGAKNSDYGLDMFFWEMGGVSGSIAKDFTSAIADVAASFDEPPEVRDAAVTNFVKFLDNVGVRQLIPFAKNALSVAESITGQSHMEPIYNAISKRGIKKVDRTFVEGVVHAALASDPTKSAAVKRWTDKKRLEFQDKYFKEKNPVKREYYKYRYERYNYLVDLFQRYTPYEVFKFYEDRQRDMWQKQWESPERFAPEAKWTARREGRFQKLDMGYR